MSSHNESVQSGRWLIPLIVLFAACGDDKAPPADTTDTADTELEDTSVPDAEPGDADTEEVDILYPGNLCDEDEQCATGLCYGSATSQGFFEPAKCQTRCLDLFVYNRYCNSDRDCCRGRCCVGCGAQEGLCTLQ